MSEWRKLQFVKILRKITYNLARSIKTIKGGKETTCCFSVSLFIYIFGGIDGRIEREIDICPLQESTGLHLVSAHSITRQLQSLVLTAIID